MPGATACRVVHHQCVLWYISSCIVVVKFINFYHDLLWQWLHPLQQAITALTAGKFNPGYAHTWHWHTVCRNLQDGDIGPTKNEFSGSNVNSGEGWGDRCWQVLREANAQENCTTVCSRFLLQLQHKQNILKHVQFPFLPDLLTFS